MMSKTLVVWRGGQYIMRLPMVSHIITYCGRHGEGCDVSKALVYGDDGIVVGEPYHLCPFGEKDDDEEMSNALVVWRGAGGQVTIIMQWPIVSSTTSITTTTTTPIFIMSRYSLSSGYLGVMWSDPFPSGLHESTVLLPLLLPGEAKDDDENDDVVMPPSVPFKMATNETTVVQEAISGAKEDAVVVVVVVNQTAELLPPCPSSGSYGGKDDDNNSKAVVVRKSFQGINRERNGGVMKVVVVGQLYPLCPFMGPNGKEDEKVMSKALVMWRGGGGQGIIIRLPMVIPGPICEVMTTTTTATDTPSCWSNNESCQSSGYEEEPCDGATTLFH